ncbi:uncharacterized protein HD556DRAFT_1314114 [Suillus plorans]|uniref:Uncharacterized protein n=1 Tax=Suillus plorans TaxID=116603 RepID=A0A9P7AAZ1_9AGAM|nr:uncharacterized protein HD556DRAFT_1314114 [Suillus plorans]KAG1785662.1 hypothetical protein HD556DRAFT_1314114 [Suillus plorans]
MADSANSQLRSTTGVTEPKSACHQAESAVAEFQQNASGFQRESRIQEALIGVQGGMYKSSRAAAKAHQAHQVSFQTLHDRATGHHQSIQSAARKRRLLSPSQEAGLLIGAASTQVLPLFSMLVLYKGSSYPS